MVNRAQFATWFGAAIQPFKDRLFLMVGRGVLTALSAAEGALMRAQIDGLADETLEDREFVLDYGMSCRPHPGAEVLALFLAGLRSNGVVVRVFDARYQIALAEGEVAIHDDLGQKVHLTRDGIVAFSPKNITVESGETLRLVGKVVECHAHERMSWDINGYGWHFRHVAATTWENLTWQIGAVMAPTAPLPINPPEGPGA